MQQRRRDDGRQCGNAWSRFENEGKEFGRQRKSEEEEVQVEILACQEDRVVQKNHLKVGGQEVVTSGYGASKNVGSPRSGDGSYRKI